MKCIACSNEIVDNPGLCNDCEKIDRDTFIKSIRHLSRSEKIELMDKVAAEILSRDPNDKDV